MWEIDLSQSKTINGKMVRDLCHAFWQMHLLKVSVESELPSLIKLMARTRNRDLPQVAVPKR